MRHSTRCGRGSSRSPPTTGPTRSGPCARRSSPPTGARESSSAAQSSSNTVCPCPNRVMMTGWRSTGYAWTRRPRGPRSDPGAPVRAQTHQRVCGPAVQRPAPRRGPGRDLPARGRRRWRGACHDQSRGVRHHHLGRPEEPERGRGVPGHRAAPGPRDHPPDGLRREHHPRRPRRRLRGPGHRPGPAPVPARDPARDVATRQGLHHPRVRHATVVGRRPPHHPLGRRRPHRPDQRRPALCARHHTIAHQRGWTATATTSEVTWHL